MNRFIKKIISMILALVLVVGIAPTNAFAESDQLSVTSFENAGVVDFVKAKYANTSEYNSIMRFDGVEITSRILFSNGEKKDIIVRCATGKSQSASAINGYYSVGTNGNSNGLRIEVLIDKASYSNYNMQKEGTYTFLVRATYNGEKYSYNVDGRILSYKELLGSPQKGTAVSKSCYSSGDGARILAYINVSEDVELEYQTNVIETLNVYVLHEEEDGNLNITQIHSCFYGRGSVPLIKGNNIVYIKCTEVSEFTAYIGEYSSSIKAKTLTIPATLTLKVGQENYLSDSMELLPETTNEKLTWTSDNTTVATVSANGKVTAIAPGTATITVSTSALQSSCLVTVTDASLTSDGKSPATNQSASNLKKQKITVNTKKAKLSKKNTMDLTKYVKVNGKAKLTFAKKSGNKKISISKKGMLTVKKGLKKGSYKVKVKISAASTKEYAEASINKTFTIKIK